jgi:hypothetical protein
MAVRRASELAILQPYTAFDLSPDSLLRIAGVGAELVDEDVARHGSRLQLRPKAVAATG